jgi:hypothetical protein
MSAPEWLKWIKPAPICAEEMESLSTGIRAIVDEVRAHRDTPSTAAIARENRLEASKFRKAAKALAELPSRWAECAYLADIRRDFERQADMASGFADKFGKKQKGRPTDAGKGIAAMACSDLLVLHDKEASTAGVAALAMWVWIEAHDGKMLGENLDAWESTVTRANDRIGWAGKPRNRK